MIQFHQHHEFDFIHQTHFHFMYMVKSFRVMNPMVLEVLLCVVWRVLIQFVIFIFVMKFIQIFNGEMAQFSSKCTSFHSHGSNLLDKCHQF
jgi:hypothetical protein